MRLREEGTASSCIDEVFYTGPGVGEKINMRRLCRCGDGDWRYLAEFRPGTRIFTFFGLRTKSGVVEAQCVVGVGNSGRRG